MKTTPTLAALMIAASALITGCSSTPMQSTSYTTAGNEATTGVIDNIQIVRLDPATSGVGAVTGGLVGALVGNQVGSGTGRAAATAAGAIGGAVVGNQVERNRNQPYDAYQITVRLDNGEYRTINQDSVYDLRVGNRVRMVDGRVYRY
ncbi:glycine zipper 2TM domain-containing protein [Pseudoduganella aquatica]|uniref:Glycine zipper 2TM domain-containing protein n=1 Tax=Pseudoduganella aquatica TaxID=2660641 RepID=A0A7X4KQC6_9BURK|nr:glycine zipper 2TM domain-containing protein [Pseudoduganella aquatica]MYN11112.1 glycine zipper 2TM domain-containing protein [Pseudoduganella aquatica]